MIAFMTACVMVFPVHNAGIDHGRIVRYSDRGDRIAYSRPVSKRFRWLTENVSGRSARGECR